MLGGVLACLGMVASSFCRTLSQLYLSAGFITGDCHSILRITGLFLIVPSVCEIESWLGVVVGRD